MRKRWTALLLALAMALALTACGGGEQPAEEESQEVAEDTQPEAGTDAADEEMPVTDTEDPEQPQNQAPQQEQQPADTSEKPQGSTGPADTGEKPQSQPVTKPSGNQDTAGQKPAEEQPESSTRVDLAAFASDLAATQTNWPGMMALEGEILDTYYPGLSDLSPKQCVVQMAMISASAVEIALVEVSNSADVDTVKGIFQSRIDYQLGDGESPGGLLYPASVELWQNNARIVSNGNYVMLVVFENADGVADAFNALFA